MMAARNTTSACVSSSFSANEGAATARDTMSTVYNNFEIADMEFYRSEAYEAFFDHLDRTGGFYYEVRPTRSHTI